MSEFDKEKEREKLREKYERDENRRESAEKMSELLLQGATMTNAHCSECGDPIFRYEGQEFCATCEKPVDRGDAQDDSTDDDSTEAASRDDAGDTDQQIEVTDPSDDARVAFGGTDGTSEETPSQEQAAETAEATETPEAAKTPTTEAEGTATAGNQRGGTERADGTRQVPGVEPKRGVAQQQGVQRDGSNVQGGNGDVQGGDAVQGGNGDMSRARESLVATLTRFSQQAAATDDPQRASEYLSAAREAAEALAALRQ